MDTPYNGSTITVSLILVFLQLRTSLVQVAMELSQYLKFQIQSIVSSHS